MKHKSLISVVLTSFLIIAMISGCGGGGGGKKTPTSANLRAAGKQIVEDTRTVWGSSENLIQTRLTELLEKTEEQINMDAIGRALHYASYPLNFDLWERLFCLEPNKIYSEQEVETTSPTGIYKTGSWTVHVVEEQFEININRSHDESTNMDTVIYSINRIGEQSVNYVGTVTYPTALLSNDNYNGSFSIFMTMSDAILDQSTFTGELTKLPGGPIEYNGGFNGNFDFKFKDSENFLRLYGSLIVPCSDRDEIVLEGDIETKDLLYKGSITASYLKNTIADRYIPSKLILDGLLQDKTETDISLDGTLTLEVRNAENINPDLDNSPDDFYNCFFEYQGTVGVGASQTETTFKTEETSPGCYSLDIIHELSSGGVTRVCSLNIANTDENNAKIEINSTWGPATVLIDLTKSEDGHVSLASGEVLVSGTKVGTISYDESLKLIKVEYNDGSFETF